MYTAGWKLAGAGSGFSVAGLMVGSVAIWGVRGDSPDKRAFSSEAIVEVWRCGRVVSAVKRQGVDVLETMMDSK